MKLTPTQARIKIRQELDKGNGIYIDARFFDVRVKGGVLQVSDFNSWSDVEAGSVFRNGNNRTLFTYEPDNSAKRLAVVSANGLAAGEAEAFQEGETFEVLRETATQYVILPCGTEKRVNKISLRLAGFRAGFGVQFQIAAQIPAEVAEDSPVTEDQTKLFILGYLTAALWSSTDTLPESRDEHGDGETVSLDSYDWAEGEAEKLHADCKDFIKSNAADLLAYKEQKSHAPEYDSFECAGHDFWLTRHGHGVGFWDRGLGELGERLSKASKTYSEVDLYLGDDLKVYSGMGTTSDTTFGEVPVGREFEHFGEQYFKSTASKAFNQETNEPEYFDDDAVVTLLADEEAKGGDSVPTVPQVSTEDIVVYDNGGETLDRYTVFPYINRGNPRVFLGLSEGGVGVSQWGELPPSSQHGQHLGTAVKFRALSEATQSHIIARLAE
jgi:hypothetical protein